jgi:hypothetical protein
MNYDLSFLWNYLQTNDFGGGGGGGYSSNAIAIVNGAGVNLTVTNPLTLFNPTPYYTVTSIDPTNFPPDTNGIYPATCTNTSGPYLLDTNINPPMLTNACGFMLPTNICNCTNFSATCTNSSGPYYFQATNSAGLSIYTNSCGFAIFETSQCLNENGPYTLDTNVSDETWGTLTNTCGYVFVPFPFASTNYGTNVNYTNMTVDVPFTRTNQALGNIWAWVANAGNGDVANGNPNGVYRAVVNFASASDLQNSLVAMTNLFGSANWWPRLGNGVGCSNEYSLIWKSGPYAISQYFVPHFLMPIWTAVPNLAWPMYSSFPGVTCSGNGTSPNPSITFHYTLMTHWILPFTVPTLTNWFTTNYTTNISAFSDWMILKPNAPANSYSIVSYNPNGQFSWMTNWQNSICTICPVTPFYLPSVQLSSPNYFSQQLGACWSTVMGSGTNLGCPTCIPQYP